MADVIFGKCDVCGQDGGDAPAADLTSADSQSNIVEAGSGVVLVKYQGRLMCEQCVSRLQADEESIRSAEKHAEAERFRGSVGFKRKVT